MTCDLCDTLLSSFRHARKHYRAVYNIQNGYIICCYKKYFRQTEMLSHCEWYMNPDAFKCTDCSKTFHDKYRLQDHFSFLHASETGKIFDCKDCDRKFSKLNYLTAHRKANHDFSLKCPICQKSITNISTLRYHIRVVHSQEDEREFKLKSNEKIYNAKKEAKPFECDICGNRYGYLTRPRNHIKRSYINRNDHSRICEICAKPFKSAKNYEIHYTNVHMNESTEKVYEKVQCEKCGKWFKNATCLYAHIRWHNSKPETCKICGRVSSSRMALLAHIRVTHNEASKECKICGKKFKSKKPLKEHMAMHYGITDLYSCNFCPKTFRSNANMYSHRKRAHPVETEELKLRKN